VEEAEARRDEIEATVDWFRQEVAVIKAAEIAALRRYFQWRMDRDGDRPRTLRQYTDERTGGVAWEAFEQDMLVLRCKFFRSRRYRFPDCLRGDAWEETLRKVLRSRR
ncbi:MAG: hypothetical protein WCK39_11420, partial [Methanomassiliicoccales archaeon]